MRRVLRIRMLHDLLITGDITIRPGPYRVSRSHGRARVYEVPRSLFNRIREGYRYIDDMEAGASSHRCLRCLPNSSDAKQGCLQRPALTDAQVCQDTPTEYSLILYRALSQWPFWFL